MSGVTKLMTAGGGGVALTPASSIASDVTVNVPSQNCTLGIQGPAFSAYGNADQTISNATNTKVNFGSELFDTNSCFASSRFTPNVAGYYQLTFSAQADYIGAARALAYIYKNGSVYTLTEQANNCTASTYPSFTINGLIYLNGATDYAEIYVRQDTGGNKTLYWNTTPYTITFSGVLVRAA